MTKPYYEADGATIYAEEVKVPRTSPQSKIFDPPWVHGSRGVVRGDPPCGVIASSVARLKADRFASFVVGDFRDGAGIYRNFVSETIKAFIDAGAPLYNEAILVGSVGSASMRVSRQFAAGRKLCKTHQNVLVFVKGDPMRASRECGEI